MFSYCRSQSWKFSHPYWWLSFYRQQSDHLVLRWFPFRSKTQHKWCADHTGHHYISSFHLHVLKSLNRLALVIYWFQKFCLWPFSFCIALVCLMALSLVLCMLWRSAVLFLGSSAPPERRYFLLCFKVLQWTWDCEGPVGTPYEDSATRLAKKGPSLSQFSLRHEEETRLGLQLYRHTCWCPYMLMCKILLAVLLKNFESKKICGI